MAAIVERMCQRRLRRRRDNPPRATAYRVGVAAPQRMSIRTLRPLVQPASRSPRRKRSDAGLDSGSSSRHADEHADAPHPLGLLRARAERPRCRAAEKHENSRRSFRPLAQETRIVHRLKRVFWTGTVTRFARHLKLMRPMSALGVRREKAALSSGCKPHPATAPAGSNRSSHGGNEVAEAFD